MEPIIYFISAFFLLLLLIKVSIQKAEIKKLQLEIKLQKRIVILLKLERAFQNLEKVTESIKGKIFEFNISLKKKQWGEREYEHYMKSKRQSFKSGGISFPVEHTNSKNQSEFIYKEEHTKDVRRIVNDQMINTVVEASNLFKINSSINK